METIIQNEIIIVMNDIIKKIEIKKKRADYQKMYRNTEKGKKATKRALIKYQNSEKGKKILKMSIKKYQQSEQGKKRRKIYIKSEKGRERNTISCRKYYNKKRGEILKEREFQTIIPTKVGNGGEILLGGYKKRNWTKNGESILRECKRRCKKPYKASMTWKAIGILLNRPQKAIRSKWREMIDKDREELNEEIILLKPNIGI
jgi:hypothetical protein